VFAGYQDAALAVITRRCRVTVEIVKCPLQFDTLYWYTGVNLIWQYGLIMKFLWVTVLADLITD
jgi:hypothetical protein